MCCESVGVQCVPDGGHAAVHHVRRRHDIGAGARVRKRRGRQPLQRLVVIHVAVHDLAAVAVAGVFAITNVGDDQQIGHFAA